jgi:hypothetical protein
MVFEIIEWLRLRHSRWGACASSTLPIWLLGEKQDESGTEFQGKEKGI